MRISKKLFKQVHEDMLFYKHKTELYELNEFISNVGIKVIQDGDFYQTINFYDDDIVIAVHESLPEARMRVCGFKNGVEDTEKFYEDDTDISKPIEVVKTKKSKSKPQKPLSTKKK